MLSLADPCPEILLARIAELVDLFEADEFVVLSVALDYGVQFKSCELLARALIVAGFVACLPRCAIRGWRTLACLMQRD